MSRETVYAALFAAGQRLTWNSGQTWAYTSRRQKLLTDLPAQPALIQTSLDEVDRRKVGQDVLRKWGARWYIALNTGKDPTAVPDMAGNPILDAVELAFTPDSPHQNTFTLGGLVHHCWIDGRITKVPGDLGDQGLIVVPISIIIP
jgi:hypothetical protein